MSRDVGSFSLFRSHEGGFFVENDLFGYGQIFVSEHDDCAIASNRLHLHRIVLDALAIRVQPNAGAVQACLFSQHSFFAQQSAIRDTLIAGVSHLPVDEYVFLRGGELIRLKKARMESALAGGDDYKQAIQRGVEEIVGNVSAALRAPGFSRIVVDVTGGKDSRMVLGSMLRSGVGREHVFVHTEGDVDSRDVVTSARLAAYLGLEYFTGDSTPQSPVAFEEGLNIWRSYYFGQYHRMAFGAWANRGLNRSDLSVGGANGEIYRSFWVAVVEKFLKGGIGVEGFCRKLIRAVRNPALFRIDDLSQLESILIEEFRLLPGESLEEKVESHYLFHRNRSHCGLRGFTFFFDRLTWYPLHSYNLLAASRSVPFSERASACVIKDVMGLLGPELLEVQFANGDDWRSCPVNEAAGMNEYYLKRGMEMWGMAQAESRAKQPRRRIGRQTLNWSSLEASVLAMLEETIDEMMNVDELSRILPGGLKEECRRIFKNSPRQGFQMASRVFAVHDAVL
jgi:hypothetical protein